MVGEAGVRRDQRERTRVHIIERRVLAQELDRGGSEHGTHGVARGRTTSRRFGVRSTEPAPNAGLAFLSATSERDLVGAVDLLVGDALVKPLLAVELIGDVDAYAGIAGRCLNVRVLLGDESRLGVPRILFRASQADVISELLVLSPGAAGEGQREGGGARCGDTLSGSHGHRRSFLFRKSRRGGYPVFCQLFGNCGPVVSANWAVRVRGRRETARSGLRRRSDGAFPG